MVIQDAFCEKCGEKYTNIKCNWCKLCLINDLKNFTSGNEKIDDLIQEMQLKVNKPDNIVFEWIPYNQFNNVKEIGEGGFAKVYSAIWKDGPLLYNDKDDDSKYEYTRIQNKKVALKCLYNSQNITSEFLNEV